MFGIWKKKKGPTKAEALFLKLRPFWKDVLDLVEHVDGKFTKLHEAGLFVGIVALLRLETLDEVQAEAIAKEFAVLWLAYISGNPNEPTCPSVEELNTIFGERYTRYHQLIAAIAQPNHNPNSSPEVQLAWDLFSNCTEKKEPAHFLNLMTTASLLKDVMREIEAETRAVLES